jgi:hypothetical protein
MYSNIPYSTAETSNRISELGVISRSLATEKLCFIIRNPHHRKMLLEFLLPTLLHGVKGAIY